jgi:hypothetical protein
MPRFVSIAELWRLPIILAIGKRTNMETIEVTTTITNVLGSSRLWEATTVAAAMLRCAVPSATTLLSAISKPPRRKLVIGQHGGRDQDDKRGGGHLVQERQ